MVSQNTDARLVAMWADFVDWDKKKKGKDYPTLELWFRQHGCTKIFDASAGHGFDAVYLAQRGFTITANELDDGFREACIQNAETNGVRLELTRFDWRDIPDSLAGTYDAVYCLGNSLTYLLEREDQVRAVKNLAKLVRIGGIVVIDHRNYEYMLKERENILQNSRTNFRFKRECCYYGDKVSGYPIDISEERVVMEWAHSGTGIRTKMPLYPVIREEMKKIMEASGLEVKTCGDYSFPASEESDFFEHVGIKK